MHASSVEQTLVALADRIDEVRSRIAGAATTAGRDPSDIRVVAVTKGWPPEVVRGALEAGLGEIGENRIQEGCEKIEAVGRDVACWHLIGHLQTNKAAAAVRFFDWFHGLDSIRLARQLQKRAEQEDTRLSVLLQVNSSGEPSKYGVSPDQLRPLAEEAARCDRLRVQGLMTMAPFDDRERVVRPSFVRVRRLFDQVADWRLPNVVMAHLSMGMSNDFEWAIAEGATMVRLGTVLFGSRED